MGTAGQFDIDPRRLGTGAFGIDADGRFMICDRCCGPCIYCASAPSGYLITLGGITLCPGWSGTVAGTYNVPFAGASGFNQSCSYIRRPAFTLYRSGRVYWKLGDETALDGILEQMRMAYPDHPLTERCARIREDYPHPKVQAGSFEPAETNAVASGSLPAGWEIDPDDAAVSVRTVP